jgi:hypothetical protein
VAPEKQATEYWLSQDVKDTIESSLRIGMNDVSALKKTPSDGVQEPQEIGPDSARQEGAVNFGAENKGVLAGDPDDIPCNTEKSEHTESEISPLVGRGNEGADKADNNHNLIEEQSEQNRGPWQTSSQEEVQEKELREFQHLQPF